jgi:hypothetical protein
MLYRRLVVILAGLHKGQVGSVLREENGLLQIMIAANDVVSKLTTQHMLLEFMLFCLARLSWSKSNALGQKHWTGPNQMPHSE